MLVREIFRLYADGKTVAEIMRLTDFPRHQANLSKHLGNPAYIGEWRYGVQRVTTTDSGRVRKPNPDEAVTIPFPPIVDRALFDAVQERKADRRKTKAHMRARALSTIRLAQYVLCLWRTHRRADN